MSLRDLLILSIVAIGALLALRRPWVGVMLWTWLSIMNPHRYAWGLAYSAPVAAAAAGSTLLGLIFTKNRQSPFQGAPVWWLLALAIWITLSWAMGIDPDGDYAMWDKVMKIYLMTFVALSLLYTKDHIIAFAWVTTASIGLLAAKGGIFTVLTGGDYRVWGPPESFIADNNHFALATIIAIPMLRFLQLQLSRAWMRHGMTAVMLLCAASALGSHSRGGLLALVAMGGVLWLRSSRKVMIGFVIALGAALWLPMMPADWWERMSTISEFQQDDSAMGRINAWHVAFDTARNYFFGGGMSYQHAFLFQEYGVEETTVRAAHSIYFQILGNHGFVGLFIFLMMWVSAYRAAGWLRRHAGHIPATRWANDLGSMAQVSLVGFAIGGAFLSLPYFDFTYNLMVMVVLAKSWVRRRAWEQDEPALDALRPLGFGSPSQLPAGSPDAAPAFEAAPPAAGDARHGHSFRRPADRSTG